MRFMVEWRNVAKAQGLKGLFYPACGVCPNLQPVMLPSFANLMSAFAVDLFVHFLLA
jgi:hypothetical protein